MAIEFQMPKKVTWEKQTITNIYGKFNFEPLERGYGVTLGNAFRRVLLSSIPVQLLSQLRLTEFCMNSSRYLECRKIPLMYF